MLIIDALVGRPLPRHPGPSRHISVVKKAQAAARAADGKRRVLWAEVLSGRVDRPLLLAERLLSNAEQLEIIVRPRSTPPVWGDCTGVALF